MRHIKIRIKLFFYFFILSLFFCLLSFENLCLAQSISQIERTQEVLEKERVLREKLGQEEKVFIKQIIFTGASLLTEEEIKEIISPFQKRWLSKNEIELILDLIKQTYSQKVKQPPQISYHVKKRQLIIEVKEVTP